MKKNMDLQLGLQRIRQRMLEEETDAWLVVNNDYHQSEYVGDYFKCREFISGFTGSAGSVLILQNEAGLWTDGRYYLQAERELEGSGIRLYKSGEEGVLELEEYLLQKLPEGACFGVDGRTICISEYRKLKKKLDKKRISIRLDCDLVGDIWTDRPFMSCKPAWELETCFAGMTRTEKLRLLRQKLMEEGADCSLISSLEDIAWTLNVRGGDIACTPVVLGYLLIRKKDAIWFVQEKAVNKALVEKLLADGVYIRGYHELDGFLSAQLEEDSIYLDPDRTSMHILEQIKKKDAVQRKVLEGRNITLLPKAVKNPTEIKNMFLAHKKDAAACIKFICWLKKNVCLSEKGGSVQKCDGTDKTTAENAVEPVTEMSAAQKLEEFRREQEHYLGPSFDTIAGYADHGAIVHYKAAAETDRTLKAGNFILIDSGGHYLEGTTDITRTIALGPLTREQKHHYTLVLKGNLDLAAAKFKYGSAGISLDCLARKALWKEGMDYNHGTGHGVGYLLGVHEPPNAFRNRVDGREDACIRMEPGMITSNEPGIYLPGKYGIRLENLIVCIESEKNEFGRFLAFETMTLVPFERDAILADELEDWERDWLNRYHARIRKEMAGYLDAEETEWLKRATEKI